MSASAAPLAAPFANYWDIIESWWWYKHSDRKCVSDHNLVRFRTPSYLVGTSFTVSASRSSFKWPTLRRLHMYPTNSGFHFSQRCCGTPWTGFVTACWAGMDNTFFNRNPKANFTLLNRGSLSELWFIPDMVWLSYHSFSVFTLCTWQNSPGLARRGEAEDATREGWEHWPKQGSPQNSFISPGIKPWSRPDPYLQQQGSQSSPDPGLATN